MNNKIKNLINKIIMTEITCIIEIFMAPVYFIDAIFRYPKETKYMRLTLLAQIILDFFGAWFMIIYMPYSLIRKYKEEK